MEATGELSRQRLVADLNQLRRTAGSPSLGELVRLSQRKLSRSTLHDHLAGKRTQLPPWRLVSAYVAACHAAAERTGLNAEQLGTLEEWHERWVAAANFGYNETNLAKNPNDAIPHSAFEKTEKIPISSAARSRQTLNDTLSSTSIPAVMQRLEDDLFALEKSLPQYTGLLVVINGPNVGVRFLIEHNVTTIGRDPESDIWLNDPGVSRRHAEIYRRADRFIIEDIGSINGTYLNQNAINTPLPLSRYDELGVAGFTLMFLQSSEKAEVSPEQFRPITSRIVEDSMVPTDDFRAFVERGETIPPTGFKLPRRRRFSGR
jgi:pSer/pThr/pTyr-binding forkhead associated (FHA) protein